MTDEKPALMVFAMVPFAYIVSAKPLIMRGSRKFLFLHRKARRSVCFPGASPSQCCVSPRCPAPLASEMTTTKSVPL
jgi:hypothetical protein